MKREATIGAVTIIVVGIVTTMLIRVSTGRPVTGGSILESAGWATFGAAVFVCLTLFGTKARGRKREG